MRHTILVGGKAGQGPNVLTNLLAEALVSKGYHVFSTRDYESVIRGGHNFNVLTFSPNAEVYSNDAEIDILVCLDEESERRHSGNLKTSGILVKAEKEGNMFFAGRLFRLLCLEFKLLEQELKKLKNFSENLKNARRGYDSESRRCDIVHVDKDDRVHLMNGSQGIALGAVNSGLDLYYAYPMTPATPVLFELALMQKENNFLTIELENETAVMMAGLGSSATGAKVMVGTSGGGFDLMTEGLSMAGMAEIPIVVYLAIRPGPSTGVATYTSQGDLQLARHCGHGEFFRLVLAPGNPTECQELSSQAFYLTQKYKIPAIVMSDKHLAESFFTITEEPQLVKSEKSIKLGRYNSYEHAESGEATESPEVIIKGFERRARTQKLVEKEASKFEMFKIHGNKDSKNLIVSFGSTKGVIVDAISSLDAKFLQILYIEPFSEEIKAELEKAKKIILVENDATGQLADVIREKTGILVSEKILRYDGRPFLADELNLEIKKRLK